MSQFKRMFAPALLSALVTLSAGAVSNDPAALEQGKRDMVSAAVEKGAAPPHSSAAAAAIDRAAALVAIEIDSTTATPTVALRLEGEALASARVVEDGTVLRIELRNTIPLPKMQSMVIDGGNLISSVKTELASLNPQFVTQIEIALDAEVEYTFTQNYDGVRIELSKVDADSAPTVKLKNRFQEQRQEVAVAYSVADELSKRAESALTDASARCRESISEILDTINDARVALLEAELADVSGSGEYSLAEFKHSTEALREELAIQDPVVRQARLDLARALDTYIETQRQLLTSLTMNGDAAVTRVSSDEETLEGILADSVATDARISALTEDVIEADARESEAFRSLHALLQSSQTELLAFITSIRKDLEAEQGRLQSVLVNVDRAAGTVAAKVATADGDVNDRLARLDAEFSTLRAADTMAGSTVEQRLVQLNRAMARVADVDPAFRLDTQTSAALTTGSRGNLETPSARRRPSRLSGTSLSNPEPDIYRLLGSPSRDTAKGSYILMAQATGISDSSSDITRRRPDYNLYRRDVPAEQDPLQQLVNIDFRDMDLTNVVSLLAQKAQISVMAGAEVSGTVTANLRDVPLGRAIEIILRMNGLGIVEESGVYRITTYEEAVASRREMRMIFLKNAQAVEVQTSLEALVSGADAGLMSISSNPSTNVLILAGPNEMVVEFEDIIARLDVAEPVMPTVTVPIKLNYALPIDVIPVIQPLLSETGRITGDPRSRQVIITDLPVRVEDLIEIIASIDLPVKQVSVEAMIVDVILEDRSQTGIDWTLDLFDSTPSSSLSLVEHSTVFADTGTVGLGAANATAGNIAFGILTSDIDIRAALMGEVASNNATLLANPTVVTIENQPARISIAEEIPYIEQSQSDAGGSQTTTKFKEIGTVLEVTPRVTHDNHIILTIDAKQSDTKGVSLTGVPIEDKREASTTLRLSDGQTVYIGGLRKFDDDMTIRKVPILGDIPFLSMLFSNRDISKQNVELLIFITCHVLPDDFPELTPYQKQRYDMLGGIPETPDATRAMVNSYVHSGDIRDPFYKWKRTK